MPLTQGTRLGPYEIAGRLGAGGMGEVYRAKDSRIGRDVAIKVLPDAFANDPEGLARFEQEARAAGMLNHPNLLTIYDVGREGETFYIVSELLTGETLRDLMNQQPIPRRKVIDYGLQIANGLAAAHEKGIVHRDLKPENVFITLDERAKILDFGLAKLQPGIDGPIPQNVTQPGIVMGTVGYMSPEQVRGEKLDHRSDIFSFGAILYEMLTGARAFRRDSTVETLSAILKEDPIDLDDTAYNIPPELERVVRRCLEKSRERRFQSARDLAFHLESLPALHRKQPPPASPTPPHLSSNDVPTMRHPSSPEPSAATPSPAEPQHSSAPRAHPPITGRLASIPQKPQRKGPSAILIILTALLFAIAGAVGGYIVHDRIEGDRIASFQRLTFRRGEVLSARFAPDGDTILYSAAWDGHQPAIFMMRRQSPESKPFGIENADVASISRSGELAILLGYDRVTRLGTLARVPAMGGTPRPVLDDVLNAEWMPDGEHLAVIRRFEDKYRLEVPMGNVVLESATMLRFLRVSADGKRIAFVQPNRGQFDIVMIEQGQPEILTSGWRHGITGLAWSADGKKLWFTATDSGTAPPSLYSVTPGKDPTLESRLTGALGIEDVSNSGRVLLTHTTWRATLTVTHGDPPAPRDLSWLDWSTLRDLSNDGQWILFSETREGGGKDGSVYVRRTDGSPPVRLGIGFGDSISPDGKWVVAHATPARLVKLPTGTGEPEDVHAINAVDSGVRWFPDGRRLLMGGSDGGSGYRLFVHDLTTGESMPLTPEGIWGAGMSADAISPDGRFVAGMNADARLTIYPVNGAAPIPVPSAKPEEIPAGWDATGTRIWVYRPGDIPARITQIDLATGERVPWKEIAPDDPAGTYRIAPILATPDGTTWAYNSFTSTSNLYVAEGIR